MAGAHADSVRRFLAAEYEPNRDAYTEAGLVAHEFWEKAGAHEARDHDARGATSAVGAVNKNVTADGRAGSEARRALDVERRWRYAIPARDEHVLIRDIAAALRELDGEVDDGGPRLSQLMAETPANPPTRRNLRGNRHTVAFRMLGVHPSIQVCGQVEGKE